MRYFFSDRYQIFVDEDLQVVSSQLEISDFYTIQDEMFELLANKKNVKTA